MDTSYYLGILTGTMLTLIFIFSVHVPDMVYLVQSNGVVVESVIKMEDRGTCLLALEEIYNKGPNPSIYQCVGKDK